MVARTRPFPSLELVQKLTRKQSLLRSQPELTNEERYARLRSMDLPHKKPETRERAAGDADRPGGRRKPKKTGSRDRLTEDADRSARKKRRKFVLPPLSVEEIEWWPVSGPRSPRFGLGVETDFFAIDYRDQPP